MPPAVARGISALFAGGFALAWFVACGGTASETAPSPSAIDAGNGGDASGVDARAGDDEASAGDDGGAPIDDASDSDGDGGDGSASNACEWGGAPGQCITTSACTALTGHTSYAGECPGPATIECCIVTPSTSNNPPTPAGYELMQQSEVTPDMTTWAVAILDDPTTYPMFSTTTRAFGALTVLARVEWHPPDFQNSVVHRGVTLYEPT